MRPGDFVLDAGWRVNRTESRQPEAARTRVHDVRPTERWPQLKMFLKPFKIKSNSALKGSDRWLAVCGLRPSFRLELICLERWVTEISPATTLMGDVRSRTGRPVDRSFGRNSQVKSGGRVWGTRVCACWWRLRRFLPCVWYRSCRSRPLLAFSSLTLVSVQWALNLTLRFYDRAHTHEMNLILYEEPFLCRQLKVI